MNKVQTRKLSNGVTLICETTDDDMSYIGIGFKVGSRNETEPRLYGIAHCLEHMMFKSTKNRSTQEISSEMDNLGVINNAYTGVENTVYHSECRIGDLDKVVEIMFDSILNHLFKEDELEIEKEVIHQEILMNLSNPDYHVTRFVCNTLYDEQNGHEVLGSWDTVSKLTRDDLEEFYQNNYTSNRCVISFVGKLTMLQLIKLLTPYCEKLKFGFGYIEPTIEFKKSDSKSSVVGLEQHNIFMVGDPLSIKDKKYKKNKATMQCLNFILSNGMSSRLWSRIREELGLVYGIRSSVTDVSNLDIPVISCTSSKDPEYVIYEIKNVLNNLIENGVTSEELNKAKRQYEISLMIRSKELNYLYLERIDDFLCRGVKTDKERTELLRVIGSVTKEEVVTLAKKCYQDCGVIIVSPVKKSENIFVKTINMLKQLIKKVTN